MEPSSDSPTLRGRGASRTPDSRFLKIQTELDPEQWNEEWPSPKTEFFENTSKTVLSENKSPDIGMEVSLNAYRGCEHGCVYCYARPTHEYFGLSAGTDFESKILVKKDAPEILRKALLSPKWQPKTITMSGVTDCYQPAERKFRLTRACLQVLAEFRNPAVIITKNYLVTRDIDVLSELAQHQAILVLISITSLDTKLARLMEPRTSSPSMRLQAVRELSAAKIPVGVNVAPVIPGLNDHEIPAILKAAREAGAEQAGYTTVRLPYGVKDVFEDWLGRYYPMRKDRVLNRIREIRGGKLNDPNFHSRMRGSGTFADQIRTLFYISKQKAGFEKRSFDLSTKSFRRSSIPDLFET